MSSSALAMACSSSSSGSRSNKDSLEDCMCTICLCILIHPVTLPCGHELCMPCFKQNVEETSLTCPLCRTRISTWTRRASKSQTLVNQKRWEQIQKLFPCRVQRRLDGLDEETDEEFEEKEEIDVTYRQMVQLSKPGEIRKEYEAELARLRAQEAAEREREEEASASLIRNLCSVEERADEEARIQQQEIARRDAQLALELNRVINTAATDTPVNQLLQEARDTYPHLPHHLPSIPTTPTLPPQDAHRGKQLQVKNNNKTLETFFRRLPAGRRTTARSSSEPKGGEGEGSRNKHGLRSSPRCQSAPVRGKENLPLLPESHMVRVSVDNINHIEDLDSDIAVEVKTGDARQRTVESVTTVHSDGSDSVIVCGEENSSLRERDSPLSVIVCDWPSGSAADCQDPPLFKPIQSSPITPPSSLVKTVPLEPCVVRITPRILFNTRCLSSTSFPVVSSPLVSSSHFNRDSLTKADFFRQGGTENMGSLKSKLWTDDSMTKSDGLNGGHVDRRARSSSPTSPRVVAHGSVQSHRDVYCRPALRDRRHKMWMLSSVKESVSDSELSTPSPKYQRCLRSKSFLNRMRGTRGGGGDKMVQDLDDCVRESGHGSERNGANKINCVKDNKSEDHLSSNLVDNVKNFRTKQNCNRDDQVESHSSDIDGHVHSLSSAHHSSELASVKRIQDIASVSDGVTSRRNGAPDTENINSADVSAQPCTSSDLSERLTVSPPSSPSSRPVGIFNPDTIPEWSQGLYADTVVGKGKRLVKKSTDSGLSQRNGPKSLAKTRSHSVEQQAACNENKLKGSDDGSPGLDRALVQAVSEKEGGSGERTWDVDSAASAVCPTSPLQQKSSKDSEDRRVFHEAHNQNDSPLSGNLTVDGEDQDEKNRTTTRSNNCQDPHFDSVNKLTRRVKNRNKRPTQTSEIAVGSNKAEKTTQKKSKHVKKPESSLTNQKSIRDWFCRSQTNSDMNCTKQTQPSHTTKPSRKAVSRTETHISDTALESDLSSSSSSSATSPHKMGIWTSPRARKINPKLNDFVLTVTNRLQQVKASMDSDSTPVSTPSKVCRASPMSTPGKACSTTPASTPSKACSSSTTSTPASARKSQKRKREDKTKVTSPGKRRKATQVQSPSKPRDSDYLSVEEDDVFSDQDEEGLSQEERDRRVALRLQRQFDLADKLNLKVVRFKGTDDQYSLRAKQSEHRD